MNAILQIIMGVVLVFSVLSCREGASSSLKVGGADKAEPIDLSQITSDGIKWRGDFTGLQPVISSPMMLEMVESSDPRIDNKLLERLDAKDGWVAAHVILSLRYIKKGGIIPMSGRSWNTLRVSLDGNGNAKIDPSQQLDIKRLWKIQSGEIGPALPVDKSKANYQK